MSAREFRDEQIVDIGGLRGLQRRLKETKVRLRRHDLTGRIPIDDLLVAGRRSKGLLITQILPSINLGQWLVGAPERRGLFAEPGCDYIFISYHILHFK